MRSSRSLHALLVVFVTALSIAAQGTGSWPLLLDCGGAKSRCTLGPPIAFATLTAATASSSGSGSSSSSSSSSVSTKDSSEDLYVTSQQQQQQQQQQEQHNHHHDDMHSVILRSGRTVNEFMYKTSTKNSVVPVTLTGDTRFVVEFNGEANHIISIVAQLLENRYDSSIPVDNCYGLYINVEVRTKDEVSGAGDADGDNSSSTLPYRPSSKESPSAWSLFWNAIATILDSSAFCNLLPMVMLRVAPTAEEKAYYFIINSRRGYAMSSGNSTCQMRVFVQQSPVEAEVWMQNVFALALPLVFLLLTAPYTLWRIDLLPAYLSDIDVVGWLWYPPYALRNAVIGVAVSSYMFLLGLYTERRARQHQSRLEEQHRRLMEEARARQRQESTSPTMLEQEPQQQHQATVPTDVLTSGYSTTSHHGESEHHTTTAVHISLPQQGAAEAVGTPSSLKRKKHMVVGEKQQLLRAPTEDEEEPHASLVATPKSSRLAASVSHYPRHSEQERGESAVALTNPREMTEMDAPCVVQMQTPGNAQEKRQQQQDTAAEDGTDPKKTAAASHTFLYQPSEEEEDERICRICRDGEEDEKLVSACECTGSVRWVHRTCLDHWRMESAKRNVRNVNRCEICKKPFSISIRRRTLLWQSSRHIVLGIALAVSVAIVFAAATVSIHATLGEMSCRTPWRTVAYRTMFNLDGMILTMFAYFMLTLLAAFAFALVYSRWHVRAETEAHVHEFQLLPEFWTRRNTAHVVAVYVTGLLQALALGYLVKLFIYHTSSVVWNWEASPSIGAVMYMTFITLGVSAVRRGREFLQNRAAPNTQEVVVEDQHPPVEGAEGEEQPQVVESPEAAVEATTEGETNAAGQSQQQEEPQVEAVAQQLRPIRAVEYCPRRPVSRPT